MKVLTASAFALAMLVNVGAASACEWSVQQAMAYATPQAAPPGASAELKRMAIAYLTELSEEKRLS